MFSRNVQSGTGPLRDQYSARRKRIFEDGSIIAANQGILNRKVELKTKPNKKTIETKRSRKVHGYVGYGGERAGEIPPLAIP